MVRLKVSLLRAGLRGAGVQAKLGLAVSVAFALLFGGGAGILIAFGRLIPDRFLGDFAVGVAATMFVGWVLFPLILAAADGTLEVDKLAQFPLTRRQLMPGLLVASLIGTGGLASVLLLLGLLVAMAPASPLAMVTVVAVAVLLGQCVAASRLLTTLLSGAAKRRRWRDVAVFVGPLLAVSINVGVQLLSRGMRLHRGPPAWMRTVGDVARWLPTGITARALAAARSGDAASALGWLVLAGATLAALVALWGMATERVLTSASSAGSGAQAARRRRGAGRLPLYGWLLAPLPRTRTGVVAAKELRLSWRDPRQRVALVMPILAAAAPLIGFIGGNGVSGRFVFAAALPAMVVGSGALAVYGFDGPAHWMNVAAGDDARSDLRGKVLSRLLITGALSLAAASGIAVLAGAPGAIPLTMALAVYAVGVSMGIALPFGVRYAQTLPDSTTNVFSAGNAGARMTQGGPAIAISFATMALLAPFGLGAVLTYGRPLPAAALGVVAVALGAVALHLGLSAAVRASADTQPELLEKLGRRIAS